MPEICANATYSELLTSIPKEGEDMEMVRAPNPVKLNHAIAAPPSQKSKAMKNLIPILNYIPHIIYQHLN